MKCVITAVNKDRAVLLNESGEFITVASKNYHVGQKIEYKKQTYNQFRYLVASVILLMMLSVSSYAIYYTPVSYMSVDINPSIQLGINRFDKIVSVQPMNEDAKALLDTIQIDNQDVNQSVDTIIEASKILGYLTQTNNHVEVDVVTKSDKLMDRVNEHMNRNEDHSFEISVERANNEDMILAKELKVSIGRTKAIQKYTEAFGGEVKDNATQLSTTTVGEIRKAIVEKKINEMKSQPTGDAQKSDQTKRDILRRENSPKKEIQEQIDKAIQQPSTNGAEPSDADKPAKKETIKERIIDRLQKIKQAEDKKKAEEKASWSKKE